MVVVYRLDSDVVGFRLGYCAWWCDCGCFVLIVGLYGLEVCKGNCSVCLAICLCWGISLRVTVAVGRLFRVCFRCVVLGCSVTLLCYVLCFVFEVGMMGFRLLC